MKPKIFKPAIITLAWVLAFGWAKAQKITDSVTQLEMLPLQSSAFKALSGPFTTDMFTPQDSASRREYHKLETQMAELRKKMSKLRSESFKKNFKDSLKNSIKNYNQQYMYKFPDIKGDIQKSIDKSFEALQKLNYTYDGNVSGLSKGLGVTSVNGSNSFFYKGGRGDDYIKRKVASGEIKEKTRSYTKSYAIDGNDKVAIDNVFGKVAVNTWAKNEVKVDVQIKVDADDDAAAQQLLDAVSIDDSKSGSEVSFKTNIKDVEHKVNHINVSQTEVNYTVYMPAKNQLQIRNRFGSVKLPNLAGRVTLNINNGSLVAQQLTNPQNDLNIKFGDANIESLNSNSVNLSYGKLNVGTADNLNAKLSFATSNVDRLNNSGDITIRYGDGIKIGKLSNVKNLNVDAAFTKVLLNLNDDYNFDVNTRLGSFDYDDNKAVKVIDILPETGHNGTTKNYKGKVGKGSSIKNITITSKLSSVKFDDAKH